MGRPKTNADGLRLRKVRPDAALLTLPEETQGEIAALMDKYAGYTVCKILRGEEIEVQRGGMMVRVQLWAGEPVLTSPTALYNFGAHWRAGQRFLESRVQVHSLLEEMRRKEKSGDARKVAEWADALILHTSVTSGDSDTYIRLRTLMEKARQTDMDARKLAMLEAKAAQAEAAQGILKEQLSPEEQNRRLREILK